MVMSLVVTTVAAKGFAKLAKTNGQKTNDTRMPRNNPRVAHSDASISSLINSL
jgi:hypothetical protein